MALNNLDPRDVLFQKILHRGMGDKSIQDVTLIEKKAAVKEGDNYLSYLTRLTLKYTCNAPKGHNQEKLHKIAHLILKEEPHSKGKALEFIREANIFKYERLMLEEVVPKIEALVGRKFGPKIYYASDEPHTIVMEDLMALGFHNKNRKVGLTEAQVIMVLEYLADFHAASVSLHEQVGRKKKT